MAGMEGVAGVAAACVAGESAARVPAAANRLISASAAADTIASDKYRRNMDVFMGLLYLPF
jgi:hypothetical protein